MQISVIIPTLNEEALIGPLVRHLRENSSGHVLEILVADGGSSDQTVAVAEAAGAKIVPCPKPGRAHQMNTGARIAQGDVLHFVHADSFPPQYFDATIVEAVGQGKSCGCFRSRFITSSRFLLLNSYCTRFPGLLFRGGGQTLFVEKKLFWEVGGYDEQLHLMEEYDLIRRLRRRSAFSVLPQTVLVSARKYARNGNVRLQMAYGVVMLLFFLGVSQPRLRQVYHKLIS